MCTLVVKEMSQEGNCSDGVLSTQADSRNRLGFQLHANELVRLVADGIYAAKLESGGSYVIENQDGHWICECGEFEEECPHIYAAQLLRQTIKHQHQFSQQPLKCRYCGSPDLRGCGFRYNAQSIARRYFCNECHRKFSVKHRSITENAKQDPELIFTLTELGNGLTRLNSLLESADRWLLRHSLGSSTPARTEQTKSI
jgi:transposase-like protein